ncbi:MAG: PrgI family protein [Lachnospiraceae bacterium]|nr:PrgI family protein [Lachnospiraceae bacterium]
MKIEINKDFSSEYKDEFWKGFSGTETVCIGIAAAVAVGVIAFCHFKLGINPGTAVYFGVPAAIPVLILGFFRYQGYMNILELLQSIALCEKTKILKMNMMTGSRNRVFAIRRDEKNGVYADTKKTL